MIQCVPGEVHAVVTHVGVVLAEAVRHWIVAERLELVVLGFGDFDGTDMGGVLIDFHVVSDDAPGTIHAAMLDGCEAETLRRFTWSVQNVEHVARPGSIRSAIGRQLLLSRIGIEQWGAGCGNDNVQAVAGLVHGNSFVPSNEWCHFPAGREACTTSLAE